MVRFAYLVIALALSMGLAACAKKSAPLPPSDVPDTYHRAYPSE